MKIEIENEYYNIPSIPQLGEYRYAKDCSCECHAFDMNSYEGYIQGLKDWHIDGLYDSNIGLLICFTCNRCGEKFCFHIRENLKYYKLFGLLDEYVVHC